MSDPANHEPVAESDTITRVHLQDREILIIGTAHVSKESAEEAEKIITTTNPERVCVEIDEGRYRTMTEGRQWENLDIVQVIKQKRGFLLLTNLVLSSFQRRLGVDLGTIPGQEMLKAIETAKENRIPFSLIDREVQTTMSRAWRKTGFWGKNKLIASLTSSAFTSEKISEEDIEKLKEKSALDSMMDELAEYLPSVKKVLIDERDQYMAAQIHACKEKKIVAIVGAGHVPGIVRWLNDFDTGQANTSTANIDTIPAQGVITKILPWIIPAAIFGIIAAGFINAGWRNALEMLKMWVLVNGSLSAIGAIAALAHPLTVIISFIAAPITSMNPTIGVGLFSGIVEAALRKPRVIDFENLHDDILNVRGFYRNRLTHALVVFLLSSVGSAIGTFIGIPFLTSLIGG